MASGHEAFARSIFYTRGLGVHGRFYHPDSKATQYECNSELNKVLSQCRPEKQHCPERQEESTGIAQARHFDDLAGDRKTDKGAKRHHQQCHAQASIGQAQ